MSRLRVAPPSGSGSASGQGDCWSVVSTVLPVVKSALLHGLIGSGKSTTGANLASRQNAALSIVVCTSDLPVAEIRGHYVLQGQEFRWKDGPVVTRFREGGVLLLEEIDQAPGEVWTFLMAVLDDPSWATLHLPTNEVVPRHPQLRVVATMNGDPDTLPEALVSRFEAVIRIDRPHPDAVASLPADLRNAAQGSRGFPSDVSLRHWKHFAALREMVGEEVAARAAFPDHHVQSVLDALRVSRVRTGG